MTTQLHDGPELDQHLRRTLLAVAGTVQEGASTGAFRSPGRRRRRKHVLVGVGAAIAALPVTAAAVVGFGPEHVDRIPPPNPILSGSVDGERYWVVDGRNVPRCEGRPSGVEVIAEGSNVVGQEWNTFGYSFGERTADGCVPRLSAAPPEDSYFYDGGQKIGDGMLWAGALHPRVEEVRVSLDGAEPFDAETFEHEGGRYYVLEVPPGTTTFSVEYLVGGEVVSPPAGESAQHVVSGG